MVNISKLTSMATEAFSVVRKNKPNSLGEGLSRVKKKLGAIGEDLAQLPGTRIYSCKSQKGILSIETSNLSILDRTGSVTNVSRLRLGTNDPKMEYVVDYCTSKLGFLEYRHRMVSKVQELMSKNLTTKSIFSQLQG